MTNGPAARTRNFGRKALQAVVVNLTCFQGKRKELLPRMGTLVRDHGLFGLASQSEHCQIATGRKISSGRGRS